MEAVTAGSSGRRVWRDVAVRYCLRCFRVEAYKPTTRARVNSRLLSARACHSPTHICCTTPGLLSMWSGTGPQGSYLTDSICCHGRDVSPPSVDGRTLTALLVASSIAPKYAVSFSSCPRSSGSLPAGGFGEARPSRTTLSEFPAPPL